MQSKEEKPDIAGFDATSGVGTAMARELAIGQSFVPVVRTARPGKVRVNKYALCRCGSHKPAANCCGY